MGKHARVPVLCFTLKVVGRDIVSSSMSVYLPEASKLYCVRYLITRHVYLELLGNRAPNRFDSEALICGSLSLVASSLIEWMAWPSSLSVAGAGSIGFLGVTAIRELVTRFIDRKVDAA